MGSYNTTCGMSHASISCRDEALIVVLLPSSETRRNDPFDNTPYGVFPVIIRGKYNDYGGLSNIESTPGTRLLEDAFEVSIEAFVECLTDMRDGDPLSSWAQFMRPEFMNHYRKFGPFSEEGLQVVGFTEVNPNEIPSFRDGSLVNSDDTWWIHSDVPDVFVRITPWTGDHYHQKVWSAYKTDVDCKGNKCLDDLVIGWRSNSDSLFNLLDCIYHATGVHLAYPIGFQNKTFFHRVKDLTYVWVHGEVFDTFSKPMKDDLNTLRKYWWEEKSPSPKYLDLLGFVEDKDATEKRRNRLAEDGRPHRYYKVYKHKSSEEFAVFSDGRFSCIDQVDSDKQWPQHSTYTVEQLIKVWKKLTKEVLEIPESVRELDPNTMDFRELSKALNEFNKKSVPFEEKWWHDPLSKHSSNRNPILCFENEWTEWEFLKELFGPGILDGSLENEMVQMSYFIQNFRWIGHPVRPMPYYGPQFGNYSILKEFGRVITKIANDNLRRRKEV